MEAQVSSDMFEKALVEYGVDPENYRGKKLTLEGMENLYELNRESLIEAISHKRLTAHYDYKDDVIWVDALEAAYFYYCVESTNSFYANMVSEFRLTK